jgi:hypothetical protein
LVYWTEKESSLEILSVYGEGRLSDHERYRSVHLWQEERYDQRELILDLDGSSPDGPLREIYTTGQGEHPAHVHDPMKQEVDLGMMVLLPALESRRRTYILARKCRLWAPRGDLDLDLEAEGDTHFRKGVDHSVRAIGRGEDWHRNGYSWRQNSRCFTSDGV